jgi:diphosphate-dependent phosphofructokinase
MNKDISILDKKRLLYKPMIPDLLKDLSNLEIKSGEKIYPSNDKEEIKKLFPITYGSPIVNIEKGISKNKEPLKIGVVFSGGQASGGHNVISGVFDAIKDINSKSKLIGFLNGPVGICDNKYIDIEKELIDQYRNMGGFDLIGSGRTKIETDDQLKSAKETIEKLDLDGLVIIGGDDSNTNACVLAEYLKANNLKTSVIGVPKTIDGDLRNEFVKISFGFDSACKVYGEMIGNIQRDCLSAKKYYHFIRLMGRSASHIALECFLKTHANYVIIAEEVFSKKQTLENLIKDVADIIEKRAEKNKNYGTVLIPEGIIEFIPEIKELINELNSILADGTNHQKEIEKLSSSDDKIEYVNKILSDDKKAIFNNLGSKIQSQLLLDRDPHGNVQVSLIESEKLIVDLVKKQLKKSSSYKGRFKAHTHFFGYEGRACLPSNFDAQYCYSLGRVASILINEKLTGYMSCILDIEKDVRNWRGSGIPITGFMNIEKRQGKDKPVIKKALVELDSKAFKMLKNMLKTSSIEDDYIYPGSIQYFGERQVTDTLPLSITL